MIAQICEAFHCTPDVAMLQDALLCEQIMLMRSFAELSSMEKHNPKALSAEQRRFVLQMEKDAGLILQG